MRYLKLYEQIDWSEDWDEEDTSIPPEPFQDNELLYKFLVDNNALDNFIKSFRESDWNYDIKGFLKHTDKSEII